MKVVEDERQRLGRALALNVTDGAVEHVVVALPSFSVGESLLSHYADRIPALEHRYLLTILILSRIERCVLVYVCCSAPTEEQVEYYLDLLPEPQRASVRSRFHVVEVPDRSARSVAAKLLDRPDLIARLDQLVAGRPAFIEPWNVSTHEGAVASALGLPINGTSPGRAAVAHKSAGRRLFRRAGVPLPAGHEDVRSVDDVVDAVRSIRAQRPGTTGVVVKHDDSGAGDGNVVLDLPDEPGDVVEQHVRRSFDALPEWYRHDLLRGGVVEELVVGSVFRSPSVQLDLLPSGEVVVLSTHEQVLGGLRDQVYLGCRFPADPAYAAELSRHGRAVGRELAAAGALGRIAVDFATASDGDGRWSTYALEVNLRKGGTTHPFMALRHLAPGTYDADAGVWRTDDGSTRAYSATDNVVDPDRIGRSPESVISAVREAGLAFDHRTRTGVVLHMLSCLAVDGRFGLIAIGVDPEHAADLHQRTLAAVAATD